MAENSPAALSNYEENNITNVGSATQYVPPNVVVGGPMPSRDTADDKYYSSGVFVGIDGAQKG